MIDRYCRCILFLMCFTFILEWARRILGWAGPTWPPPLLRPCRSVLNMYTYSHFSLLSQKTIFSFSGIVYPHYLSFRKDFKVLPHGIFVIFDSRFVLSVLFIRKCVGFKHSNFCSWKLLKYHFCRTLLSD
jgi:hypothetical protein